MAKRIVTKIGDIFCVELDDGYKSYFQYIANDMTQLNSSVIRAFVGRYPMDYQPDMDKLVKSEVAFYAHTVLRIGLVGDHWYKVGKSKDLGLDELASAWFVGESSTVYNPETDKFDDVDPLEHFYVWHCNESHIPIGKMTPEISESPMTTNGSVLSWFRIVERIKYGYTSADLYLNRYVKQKPWPWVESYLTYFDRMARLRYYFHFKGEKICREVIRTSDGNFINLSENDPEKDGYALFKGSFGDISWCAWNVTGERFNTIWDKHHGKES